MALAVSPKELTGQRVILYGISWTTYECLLTDFTDSHAAHFAYDRGMLEITVPSFKHEMLNRALATLVEVYAEERTLDVLNAGSITLKRADIARGFEPDTCFYIQHEAHVRGKEELDLAVDPPPDLVIEVDITHPSLNKLPLYMALNVPEVWRYDGHTVTITTLVHNAYVVHEASQVFPGLTAERVAHFVVESQRLPRTVWLQQVRAWARRVTPG